MCKDVKNQFCFAIMVYGVYNDVGESNIKLTIKKITKKNEGVWILSQGTVYSHNTLI